MSVLPLKDWVVKYLDLCYIVTCLNLELSLESLRCLPRTEHVERVEVKLKDRKVEGRTEEIKVNFTRVEDYDERDVRL